MRTLLIILLTALTTTTCANYHLQFFAGEESFFYWRNREGGTKQDGHIDGIRVGVDRLKPYGWYVGADYLYARGDLCGKTGRGNPLSSELTDHIFEVRAGFTLPNESCRPTFFTPYVGWGYFKEVNDFHAPSALPCKFTDSFNFISAGFLSGVNFTPLLSMGINFKVRFMQDAESKVTDDPYYEDVKMIIESETNYRLEVPFTFTPCHCHSFLGLGGQVAPFYEFRHFGGREGFPFDFKDTKFHLLGMRFSMIFRF